MIVLSRARACVRAGAGGASYFLVLIAATAGLTGFHAGTNAAVAYAAWTDDGSHPKYTIQHTRLYYAVCCTMLCYNII